MGCNCATNKQLKELYDKYSVVKDATDYTSRFGGFKNKLEKAYAWVILITTIPLLFFYICNEYRKGNNKISLKNFFDLSYVEEQS